MLELAIFEPFCPISVLFSYFYVLQLPILYLAVLMDKLYNDAMARGS